MVIIAEAGDEGGVVGGEVDGQVEEEELPDAGVGEDVPGFFALDGGGERVSGVGFWRGEGREGFFGRLEENGVGGGRWMGGEDLQWQSRAGSRDPRGFCCNFPGARGLRDQDQRFLRRGGTWLFSAIRRGSFGKRGKGGYQRRKSERNESYQGTALLFFITLLSGWSGGMTVGVSVAAIAVSPLLFSVPFGVLVSS